MTRNPLQKGHSRASPVTPSLSAFNTDNKKSRFAGILELSDGLDSCLRRLVRAAARREVCTRLVLRWQAARPWGVGAELAHPARTA
jgi:hypothetical protein